MSILRTEAEKDYNTVFELIRNAFANEEYGDHKEHCLVERLRNSDAFVPELSVIAKVNNQIVGYILLTKNNIIDLNTQGHWWKVNRNFPPRS